VTQIAIDARPAVDPRRTGVGHYARALLRHLPPADPENRYLAWYLDVRGIGTRPRRFAGWAPNLREHASRIPSRAFGPVSVRIGVPKAEWLAGAFDLFVATNFLPPPTSSDGVVLVVHDLAFEVMPETAPHHNARWRRSFDRWVIDAVGVIVPSGSVRDDLVRRYPIDDGRVAVIHHGTDVDAFGPVSAAEIDDVRRRLGIGGPYVLFLGGLEPRKNLVTLVRAFGLLKHERVLLVVAGGATRWAPSYAAEVDRAIADLPSSVSDRVVRTGYVSDGERRALLSGAEALAYPSLYEGFGFPVLEGFAASVPVLTSTTSSLPEVAGDAAMLVDPRDEAALADGIQQLLTDDDLRNVLRAAGTARVASFTWERCARRTAEALTSARERLG
jgi:glycosyltransferase involved in cell wall biosynthesis